MKNIESSTEVLKSLMDDLQSGKGLAGTVLQNEQLGTNVQAIAEQSGHHQQQLEPARSMGHFLWHKEPAPTPPAAPAPPTHPTKP